MSAIAAFVGSIPELYDRHLGPVLFEPYARDLARRLPAEASRVVEIAAGTGRLTNHLLRSLAKVGTLVATDLNQDMVTQAARAIPADPRLSFRVVDAQELPFDDDSFDTAACQFGLMFVPDKPRALRELRRVLRPGGTLLLSTWNTLDHNPATKLVHELAGATFPSDPPTFMRIPFSLGDAAELGALVSDAGFEARVETVDFVSEASSAADFAIGVVRGNPLWGQLVERGADAAAFQQAVTDALIREYGDRPCRMPISAHVVTARA